MSITALWAQAQRAAAMAALLPYGARAQLIAAAATAAFEKGERYRSHQLCAATALHSVGVQLWLTLPAWRLVHTQATFVIIALM